VRRLSVSALLAASVLALTALSAPPADAAAPRTVTAELRGLLAAGAIDQAQHNAWLKVYIDAKRTLKALGGARRVQLDGVLANLRDLAARRMITRERAGLAFLTVERNRQWWSNSPLLSYGQRVEFSGSQLVWQFYPGQGIQVQWLGTFGRANALAAARTRTAELTQLVDEAAALAVPRAGGIAWESLFRFNGGRPPWVSGLSQGTGIQAFARAAGRLSRPDLMETAHAGLGVFRQPPPEGVRVATPAGAHYLQYSYAPSLRILNGFVQAVNGLHDVAELGDADAGALFAAGEAELRAELPAYDTGAWSLYSQFGEATLDYHKLAREFLHGLCGRLQDDLERQVPSTPDPGVYCQADERFGAYLTQPPVVVLRSSRARAKATRRLRFTLNKASTVTVTVTRRDRVIMQRSVRFGHGTRWFDFHPDKSGQVQVRLRAVDLAGNASEVTGDVEVAPARRRR
jgi:hypothetical protein